MSQNRDMSRTGTDGGGTRDHPQTIRGEGDARGSDAPSVGFDDDEEEDDAAGESGASVSAGGDGGGTADSAGRTEQREQASPIGGAQSQLSEGDAEAVRRHAGGGHSIGDAIGSSAGLDTGSGTPGDKGDFGGGDPQKVG